MKTVKVILIAALTNRRVIGKDGDLVWKHDLDMKRFRDTTRGNIVLMGRKTWASIPEKFRPLAGRTNVVITRQSAEDCPLPDNVLRYSSVEDAIRTLRARDDIRGDIYVIGGGEIYVQAMPFADQLDITHVDVDRGGDVYFPEIDTAIWDGKKVGECIPVDSPEPSFAFWTYTRRT